MNGPYSKLHLLAPSKASEQQRETVTSHHVALVNRLSEIMITLEIVSPSVSRVAQNLSILFLGATTTTFTSFQELSNSGFGQLATPAHVPSEPQAHRIAHAQRDPVVPPTAHVPPEPQAHWTAQAQRDPVVPPIFALEDPEVVAVSWDPERPRDDFFDFPPGELDFYSTPIPPRAPLLRAESRPFSDSKLSPVEVLMRGSNMNYYYQRCADRDLVIVRLRPSEGEFIGALNAVLVDSCQRYHRHVTIVALMGTCVLQDPIRRVLRIVGTLPLNTLVFMNPGSTGYRPVGIDTLGAYFHNFSLEHFEGATAATTDPEEFVAQVGYRDVGIGLAATSAALLAMALCRRRLMKAGQQAVLNSVLDTIRSQMPQFDSKEATWMVEHLPVSLEIICLAESLRRCDGSLVSLGCSLYLLNRLEGITQLPMAWRLGVSALLSIVWKVSSRETDAAFIAQAGPNELEKHGHEASTWALMTPPDHLVKRVTLFVKACAQVGTVAGAALALIRLIETVTEAMGWKEVFDNPVQREHYGTIMRLVEQYSERTPIEPDDVVQLRALNQYLLRPDSRGLTKALSPSAYLALQALFRRARMATGMTPGRKPFVVYICGDAGTGKSSMVEAIARIWMRRARPHEKFDRMKHLFVCEFPAKYPGDTYSAQPILVFNELRTNVGSEGDAALQTGFLLNLWEGQRVALECSNLADKGLAWSNAELIIVTENAMLPGGFNGLTRERKVAVLRRMSLHLELRSLEGRAFDAASYSHCTIRATVPVQGQEAINTGSGDEVNLSTLGSRLDNLVAQHLENQCEYESLDIASGLFSDLPDLGLVPQCGQCSPGVTDPNCEFVLDGEPLSVDMLRARWEATCANSGVPQSLVEWVGPCPEKQHRFIRYASHSRLRLHAARLRASEAQECDYIDHLLQVNANYSPRRMVAGMAAVAVALLSLYALLGGKEVPDEYVQQSYHPKKRGKKKATVVTDVEKLEFRGQSGSIELATDPADLLFAAKLERHIMLLKAHTSEEPICCVGIPIGNQSVLIPTHWYDSVRAATLDRVDIIVNGTLLNTLTDEEFRSMQLARSTDDKTAIRIEKLGAGSQNASWFTSADDIDPSHACTFVTPIGVSRVSAYADEGIMYKTATGPQSPYGYRYNTSLARAGVCGSPLIQHGRIVGLHCAGVAGQIGFAQRVTQSEVASLARAQKGDGKYIYPDPNEVVDAFATDEQKTSFWKSQHFPSDVAKLVRNDFMCTKDLSWISDVHKVPTDFTWKNVDGKADHPLVSNMLLALTKSAQKMADYSCDADKLRICRSIVAQAVAKRVKAHSVVTDELSWLSVITGVHQGVRVMEPLDLSKSCGSTSFGVSFVPKSRLITLGTDGAVHLDPRLRRTLEEADAALKGGASLHHALNHWDLVFRASPKQEKKEDPRKVRTFYSGPIVLIMLMRKYFGAILSAMKKDAALGSAAVGIAPGTAQWDTLYARISEANGALSMDFRKFDLLLPPEVRCVAGEFIASVCAEVDFPASVRQPMLSLADGLSKPFLILFGRRCYELANLWPSGIVGTSSFECLYNSVVQLYCVHSQNPTHNIRELFAQMIDCGHTAYGDDCIVPVVPGCTINADEYTTCMESLMLVITHPDDKARPAEVGPIGDVSFLSRGFVPTEIDNTSVVLAPLNRASILSAIEHRWASQVSEASHYKEIRPCLLAEASQHGREFYAQMVDFVREMDTALLGPQAAPPIHEWSTQVLRMRAGDTSTGTPELLYCDEEVWTVQSGDLQPQAGDISTNDPTSNVTPTQVMPSNPPTIEVLPRMCKEMSLIMPDGQRVDPARLERFTQIATVSAAGVTGNLATYQFPDALLKVPPIQAVLNYATYVSGEVELLFEVRGLPTQQGFLVASVLPLGECTGASSTAYTEDVTRATTLQHVEIMLGGRREYRMRLPYVGMYSGYQLGGQTAAELAKERETIGYTLSFDLFTPVTNSSGGDATIEIFLFARFIDCTLSIPNTFSVVSPLSGYGFNPPAEAGRMFVPPPMPYQAPTPPSPGIGDIAGGLVGGAIDTVVGGGLGALFGLSKPQAPPCIDHFALLEPGFTNANTACDATPMGVDQAGVGLDGLPAESTVAFLGDREVTMIKTNWAASAGSGDILLSDYPIHPGYTNSTLVSGDSYKVSFHPAAAATLPAGWYKFSSVVVRFKIITSALMTGSLVAGFAGGASMAGVGLTAWTGSFTPTGYLVMDIGSKCEFEIELPWSSVYPMMRPCVSDSSTAYADNTRAFPLSMRLVVQQPLRNPTNAGVGSADVYISYSFKGLEVANRNTSTISLLDIVAQSGDIGVEDPSRNFAVEQLPTQDDDQPDAPTSSEMPQGVNTENRPEDALVVVGERILDLRAFLKAGHVSRIAQAGYPMSVAGNTDRVSVVEQITIPWNFVGDAASGEHDPLIWCWVKAWFALSRGSMNYRIFRMGTSVLTGDVSVRPEAFTAVALNYRTSATPRPLRRTPVSNGGLTDEEARLLEMGSVFANPSFTRYTSALIPYLFNTNYVYERPWGGSAVSHKGLNVQPTLEVYHHSEFAGVNNTGGSYSAYNWVIGFSAADDYHVCALRPFIGGRMSRANMTASVNAADIAMLA